MAEESVDAAMRADQLIEQVLDAWIQENSLKTRTVMRPELNVERN